MLALTEDAVIVCEHAKGVVKLAPSQDFCRVEGRRLLVDDDPEHKGISGCPNLNPAIGMKPCTHTLAVREGYASFVRIGGRRLCIAPLSGLTDGTPAGITHYVTRDPGQTFVNCSE
ncbi:hypothetical protein [Caballeronia sp. ATUFL_M2_KS44]|uniref:hypothetical protein n=1 Tax=Caballeronia sp. ATUFL_M2_KS44 TaxID=2921767 RepID=UPI00202823AD|nr:hypothetical protein [Caballeronia sp. ATUFL_M2_KS44]